VSATARALSVLALGLLAAACSAELDVVELKDGGAKAYDAIDGLPFRTYERYEVAVWRRQPDGKFEKVHSQRQTIPDPERLYLLRYTGLPLANATNKVKLRADGTLQRVELADVDSQAPEAISATAAQLTAVDAAGQAREQARAAERTADETAGAAADKAELAFFTALKAAKDKEDELNALAPGDPRRPALRREAAFLQVQANLAARAAGEGTPFPGAERLLRES
jgi:hypothetical protein